MTTAGSSSRLIKTGPGQLAYTGVGVNELSGGANPGVSVVAGTLFFNGSAGNQTNHNQQEFWVGGTPASGASMIVSNAFMNLDSWFAVGRGNGNIGNTSSVSFYNSTMSCNGFSFGYNNGLPNLAFQTMTMSGNSSVTNRGCNSNIFGESAGSTVTAIIQDNSLLYSGSFISIGGGNGAVASMLVKNNGRIYDTGDFNVTDNAGSVASLTIQDNATVSVATVYIGKSINAAVTCTGTVSMVSGTFIARTGDFRVGSSGYGTVNQSGGLVIASNWVTMGRNTLGTAPANTNSIGIYNLSGGTFMKVFTGNNNVNVGENGTGTLTVSGTGSFLMPGSLMNIGIGNTGNGTVNLDGGSITVGRVAHGTGTATFNFNGGTLIAGNANANFMTNLTTANVKGGGAIIDSGTNVITIA